MGLWGEIWSQPSQTLCPPALKNTSRGAEQRPSSGGPTPLQRRHHRGEVQRSEEKPASRSHALIPFPSQYLQTVSHYCLSTEQMKRFIPHLSADKLLCLLSAQRRHCCGPPQPQPWWMHFSKRKKDLETQLSWNPDRSWFLSLRESVFLSGSCLAWKKVMAWVKCLPLYKLCTHTLWPKI